jgi:hypothetical protein
VFRDDDHLYEYLGEHPKHWFADGYDEAAVKYCENTYEAWDSYEDMSVIKCEDWKKVMDSFDSMDWENDDNVEMVWSEVIKYCKHFAIYSEVVRNFWAKEIHK